MLAEDSVVAPKPKRQRQSLAQQMRQDWTVQDEVLAQTRSVSEAAQILSAESALSLYTQDEPGHPSRAGIVLSDPVEWDCENLEPVQPAEVLAQGCLRQKFVTFEQLRRLFDLLSPKVHGRHVSESLAQVSEPRSCTFGASIFSGMASVHNQTRRAPWAVRLLNSVVQSLCPEALFSTVFLHMNVPSKLHVDAHNHPHIRNTSYLFPDGLVEKYGVRIYRAQYSYNREVLAAY